SLETSALTIAEIVWTLESYYKLEPMDVQDRILAILNTPGLQVEHADVVARAMILYADAKIDFVDAFNGLWMQEKGITSALSFDTKHFERIPRISVYLPQDLN
ncbi:MAG: hypothetical protein P1P76_11780, partial [Anaerolineales bacterium]|nr:hypothetical protein [Anaerolineales bacterium]